MSVMLQQSLNLWIDPEARTGPESMAIDEWLLGLNREPVLRVYRWKGEWGSIGYFDRLSKAREAFPGLQWVRRWTGGGTVDHRNDWAYTLVVPHSSTGERRLGGADSYRNIHSALAKALEPEGLDVRLSCGNESTGATTCFDNPVCHDLINSEGKKLAGAGQRRSNIGMMHQGSVALPIEDEAGFNQRAERLAETLSSGDWFSSQLQVPADWLKLTVSQRYGHVQWTERRL